MNIVQHSINRPNYDTGNLQFQFRLYCDFISRTAFDVYDVNTYNNGFHMRNNVLNIVIDLFVSL